MPRTQTFRKRPGFTLVELLVTITLIATLTAFGLAAVKTMRDQSHISVCASNLRQIGVAMQIHADDHQGSYPDTTHSASAQSAWIYQLEDYLGKFDGIRICPADPKAKQRLENKSSSYLLNSLVFVPPLDAFGEPDGPARNKPSLLPDPSATMIVCTASDRAGLYPGDDHTHSDLWNSWAAVLRDIAPDRHRHRPSSNSIRGNANYLYADGSVQSIPAHEVKAKIDQGINIAAIPGINR